jgi:hypothetical protein
LPTNFKPPEKQSSPAYSHRIGELRSELRLMPADILAGKTGCFYTSLGTGSGEFHLQLFGEAITGAYPDLKFYSALGDELPEFQQLLLLYYFATADGIILTGKYVSFADLPGGRMYAQAFQGYTGDEIVKVFGQNTAALKIACARASGQVVPIGDLAYSFQVLPQISSQLIYWLGDDDFPSSCKILFDAVATHYVPIDACAIIGSNLVHRVIKNFQVGKKVT